jgi:hypothetical protein
VQACYSSGEYEVWGLQQSVAAADQDAGYWLVTPAASPDGSPSGCVSGRNSTAVGSPGGTAVAAEMQEQQDVAAADSNDADAAAAEEATAAGVGIVQQQAATA